MTPVCGSSGGESNRHALRRLALAREAEVDDDAIEPRPERRVAAKVAQFCEDTQQRFLRHVFGFVGLAQHLQREVHPLRPIATHEFSEGAPVS